MARSFLAVLLALFAALGLSAATARAASGPVAVTLSSSRAGAIPVAVALGLGYEMQCGYPGPGPIVVTFPPSERLPATLAAGSVLVDGKPASSTRVSGRRVSVAMPPRPEIMCDVIGFSRVTIRFTTKARLGNPAHPGTYALAAAHGPARFSGRFTILRR